MIKSVDRRGDHALRYGDIHQKGQFILRTVLSMSFARLSFTMELTNNLILIESDARHPIDLINHLVLLSKQLVCRILATFRRPTISR